jgi:eukaryotic-like serine/threonine-protein kinase
MAASTDVKSVFGKALELATPADRAAYLDQACGGDPALRGEVEGLLAALGQAGRFMSHPAVAPPDRAAPGPDEAVGTAIGPYRLLQKLGEGGMGAVYLAEQEQPVKRRVALKLIKAGEGSAQAVARFEQERQTLALMNHPNIAQVLDAGTTGGLRPAPPLLRNGAAGADGVHLPEVESATRGGAPGRSYVVMELVTGIPITHFCDQDRLTPKDRLELFLPVCRAVQHAHQKGVIHRDLKPSNVLVARYDGRPVPKVIDFGVAKAAGPTLSERAGLTEAGVLVGTLEYMAPEQAELNNLDIDTRADIYSLGVILYELLTGSPPFTSEQLRGAGLGEMLRLVREVEPPRPSTRLSSSDELPRIAASRRAEPRTLTRQVTGELDWIVMKCLEKDRSRRYESADALASDVRRYLVDEPVSAGPPSAGYRLKKFVRRNRRALTAAGAFGALLVAGTITSTALASWALRERNHADEQKQSAEANFKRAHEAVDQMLTRVGAIQLSHVPQMELVRRDLLLDALRFYQEFLRERGDSPVVRAEAARAYRRVGMIQDWLGQWDESEKAYGQAAARLDELLAGSPGDPVFLSDLAAVHNGLFKVNRSTRRWPQAETSLGRAVELLEQIDQGQPGLVKNRYELANSYGDFVALHRQTGDLHQAEAAFAKSMTLTDSLLAGDPKNADYLTLRARCYGNVALVYSAQGRRAEAEAACEKALALNEQLLHDQPDSVEVRRNLAHTYNNLGILHGRHGQHDKAEAAHKQSLAHKEALLRDYPKVVAFMRDVAGSYANIAMEVKRRSPEEALDWSARAVRIQESAVEKDHRDVDARMGLFNTLMGRAYAFRQLERHEDAAKDWRRAIEVSEGQPHVSMRVYRPLVLVFLGEHARATAEVEALVSEGRAQGPDLNLFAEVYSLGSAAAAKDTLVPPAEREKLADQYGGRAVELLRMARAAGHFRDPARRADLKEHKNFDAIRARADFEELLVELEKTRNPGAGPGSP